MTAVEVGIEILTVLWRDYDERVYTLPGMIIGVYRAGTDIGVAAERFRDIGARRVDLPELVDLSGAADPVTTVQTLALIRDLTGLGVMVGWRLRLGAGTDWRALGHLWPPHTVLGGTADGTESVDPAARWRSTHYIGKCVYRHGPGFVQVR